MFEELPNIEKLENVKNLKQLKGSDCRYRIRVRDYRIGIEVHGNKIEVMRHRKDFYKYFP